MKDARWLAGLCVACLMLAAHCAAAQQQVLPDAFGVVEATQTRDGSTDFAQGLRDCNPKEKRRAACLDGQCVSLQTSSVHSYLICRCPAGRMGRRCEERSPSPEMITLMAQRLSEMPKEVRCHSVNYNILMKGGYENSFVECLKYEEQEYKKKLTRVDGGARSGGASRPPKRKKTTASTSTTSATTAPKPSQSPPPPSSQSLSQSPPSPSSAPSPRPPRQRLATSAAQPATATASFDGVTSAATARPQSRATTTPRLKIRHHRFLRL